MKITNETERSGITTLEDWFIKVNPIWRTCFNIQVRDIRIATGQLRHMTQRSMVLKWSFWSRQSWADKLIYQENQDVRYMVKECEQKIHTHTHTHKKVQ